MSSTTARSSEPDPSPTAATAPAATTAAPPPTSGHGGNVGGRGGGLTKTLVVCVIAAVFGSSFQFGYNNSVLNTPEAVIKAWINETVQNRSADGNAGNAGWIYPLSVSIWAIGGLIGGFVAGFFADRAGRRGAMLWNNLLALGAGALMGSSQAAGSFEMLVIGRFISGVNCGVNTVLPTMYLGEIAPVHLRGGLGVAHQLSVVCGILISQVMGLEQVFGTAALWPLALAFTVIPALVQPPLLLLLCPESPRYLLIKAQDSRAAELALSRLRDSLVIDDELASIRLESEAEKAAPKVRFASLFTSAVLRQPLALSIALHLSQQLCGINGVFYYSKGFFEKAGLGAEAASLSTIGTSAVLVLMTLISVPLMDHVGRRTLMLIGLGGIAVAEILITIMMEQRTGCSGCRYAVVAFVVLFIMSFAIGPGSIPWFIPAELFPQGARANAMSFGGAINWIANFVVGQTFEYLAGELEGLVFVPFVVLVAIFWVFLFFKMPETKNKSFEEINAIFARRALTPSTGADGYQEVE